MSFFKNFFKIATTARHIHISSAEVTLEKEVTDRTALQHTVVYACVRVLS